MAAQQAGQLQVAQQALSQAHGRGRRRLVGPRSRHFCVEVRKRQPSSQRHGEWAADRAGRFAHQQQGRPLPAPEGRRWRAAELAIAGVAENHMAPRRLRRPGGPPRERLLRARCHGGGLLRRPGARAGGPPCRQVGPRAQDLQQIAGAPGDRGPDAVVPQDFAAGQLLPEGEAELGPSAPQNRLAKVRVELRQVWLMSPQCRLLLEVTDLQLREAAAPQAECPF